MSLINCGINLILSRAQDCVISSAVGETKFKITDTKIYIPVVTLSTHDNAKLLEQLESGYKRTINWNKYQPKISPERQNQYLDFFIDSSFQGVYKLFLSSFENENDRKVHTGYHLPKLERKDYNLMNDAKSFFDQPVERDMKTYHNICKIATSQGDDYTTGCLLDHDYFKKTL